MRITVLSETGVVPKGAGLFSVCCYSCGRIFYGDKLRLALREPKTYTGKCPSCGEENLHLIGA